MAEVDGLAILTVHLFEAVEVELAHEGLHALVSEVPRKDFVDEAGFVFDEDAVVRPADDVAEGGLLHYEVEFLDEACDLAVLRH
jgi:hypothetical protein